MMVDAGFGLHSRIQPAPAAITGTEETMKHYPEKTKFSIDYGDRQRRFTVRISMPARFIAALIAILAALAGLLHLTAFAL